MKFLELIRLIIVCMSILAGHAYTVNAKDVCAQYLGNLDYYNFCQIADLHDIPMDDAGRLYALAANEYTAQICHFKMTKYFYDSKKVMLKSDKYTGVYNYILGIFRGPYMASTHNLTEFCRLNAAHLGGPGGLIEP